MALTPSRGFFSDFQPLLRSPYSLVHSFQQRRSPRRQMSSQAMEPQPVEAPLTQSATFLVLSVIPSPTALPTIRSALASVPDITKNISIRHPWGNLTCTVGIGSSIWDDLTGSARPSELHPFPEVRGAKHTAVSTPGDILLHIRSERRDLCFEFERQVMDLLAGAVQV